LKPSNVLLAGDGQALLLDFHLARAPLAAGSAAPDWLGGTPAYMAPQHRAAPAAVREGRTLGCSLRRPAPIFSLRLLLYEALAGALPAAEQAPAVALRRCNPQVSTGLADILGKCLEQEPDERYADAATLAADLRRHLTDQPLRGVANRDWRERWR